MTTQTVFDQALEALAILRVNRTVQLSHSAESKVADAVSALLAAKQDTVDASPSPVSVQPVSEQGLDAAIAKIIQMSASLGLETLLPKAREIIRALSTQPAQPISSDAQPVCTLGYDRTQDFPWMLLVNQDHPAIKANQDTIRCYASPAPALRPQGKYAMRPKISLLHSPEITFGTHEYPPPAAPQMLTFDNGVEVPIVQAGGGFKIHPDYLKVTARPTPSVQALTDEQRVIAENGLRMLDGCALSNAAELFRALLASQPASVPAQDSEGTSEFDKGWLAGLAAATGPEMGSPSVPVSDAESLLRKLVNTYFTNNCGENVHNLMDSARVRLANQAQPASVQGVSELTDEKISEATQEIYLSDFPSSAEYDIAIVRAALASQPAAPVQQEPDNDVGTDYECSACGKLNYRPNGCGNCGLEYEDAAPAVQPAQRYLCTPKNGGQPFEIDRAPDSWELRECDIVAVQAAPSVSAGGPPQGMPDLSYDMLSPDEMRRHVRTREQERCQHDYKSSPKLGGAICGKCGKIAAAPSVSADGMERHPDCICDVPGHEPPDTACQDFLAGGDKRCVYCAHEEKCHPGPGATCGIGRGAPIKYSREEAMRIRGQSRQTLPSVSADKPDAGNACGQSKETDLSKRLREIVADKGADALSFLRHQMLLAADEIERYYGGMLAWKATAEAKDRATTTSAAVSADPLQELADQAQDLDMGYGPNACPTCGKSAPAVSADAKDAERYRLIRSMSQMDEGEQEVVAQAMASVFPPDREGKPTLAEFDAGVDAAIAAQSKEPKGAGE